MNVDVDTSLDVTRLMKLNIIKNATSHGWIVKCISPNKYVLTKKISDMTPLDNNYSEFLDAIFTFDIRKIISLEGNQYMTESN